MLEELAVISIRGIGLGSVFALVAMSFNIVQVSSGILNFAQGNMLVLGGVAAFFLFGLVEERTALHWLAFLPVTALALAALLVLQGAITLRPLRTGDGGGSGGGHQDSWLITTMAASIIIGAVLLLSQGPNALFVRSVFPNFSLLGTRVPAPYALAFGLAVFCYLALELFLRRSLSGLAISALWQDPEAARAAGLRVDRLRLLAFAISGLIVGAAGFVAAPVLSITADGGLRYVLNGFIAAVIGGIGHNLGALVAGPLVGMVTMLAAYLVGGEFQGVASMALLVGVLLVRPEGIFGSTAARRV